MNIPTPKRLVLTSVNQVITLARQYPQLAEKMPKFEDIGKLPFSETPKKSCNCGGKQNFTTPDVNKQTAENFLSSLEDADFLQIKSILSLDQLCYYKRNLELRKLDLICL